MHRRFYLPLAVAFSCVLSVSSRGATDAPKKESPREFTNGIGMKFVWIPAGNFMMGSPKDEEDRRDDEILHKVTITRGFYMGVFTVTQEQYQKVMDANPSAFRGDTNLPVENVSWDDCQKFLKKLRAVDEKGYRLPTEAEWEYACRAGTAAAYHFGAAITTDQANFNGQLPGTAKKGLNRKKTLPVGSFPANAWGLHDMHGNVLQWCQDWAGKYPDGDATDPQGPSEGANRILRGGSWSFSDHNCRSARRDHSEPATRFKDIGFRVCFFPDAPKAE